MAAPSTSILDNFNRADGSLGANWTNNIFSGAGGLEIVSNACHRNETFGYANAYWSASTFGGSGVTDEVYATVGRVPSSTTEFGMWIGIAAPGTSGIDAYCIIYLNGVWQIRRIDNEAETTLGSDISQTLAVGDGVGLNRSSGVLEAWHKPAAGSWTSKGTRSDSTYTGAGYIGLSIQGNVALSNNGIWDDFGGGNVVAAVTARRLFVSQIAVKRKATW